MDPILPDSITAGLTLDRLVTLTAYPAPTWALHVALRGPVVIDLVGVPEGSQHRLAVAAPTTAAWTPGRYWYTARATGDSVVGIESGQVTILADLAAAGAGYDGRTHAERVLDAIQAVLEKRASQDQERYVINNRELWRTPIADLLQLRNLYRTEVRLERRRAAGRPLVGSWRVKV